jgi:DNA repair protein RadC
MIVQYVSVKLVREKTMKYSGRINSPKACYDIVKDLLVDADREILVVVCLDQKNKVTAVNTVHMGSVAGCSDIHPREVFKPAILSNATRVILVHNHPSGDLESSYEDIDITQRLIQSGRLLGINVLDHIVIGNNAYSAMSEKYPRWFRE